MGTPRTTLAVEQDGVAVITLENPPVNALHPSGTPARAWGASPPTRARARRHAHPRAPRCRSAAEPVQSPARGPGQPARQGHRGHGRQRCVVWGRTCRWPPQMLPPTRAHPTRPPPCTRAAPPTRPRPCRRPPACQPTHRPAGKFCAGFDINQFVSASPGSGGGIDGRINEAFCELLESGPKPTVAAIEAIALGGGCEVALACNARICTPGARAGGGRPALFCVLRTSCRCQLPAPAAAASRQASSSRATGVCPATTRNPQLPANARPQARPWACRSCPWASSPGLAARSACHARSACRRRRSSC
jgi:hypothetical protein